MNFKKYYTNKIVLLNMIINSCYIFNINNNFKVSIIYKITILFNFLNRNRFNLFFTHIT